MVASIRPNKITTPLDKVSPSGETSEAKPK